MTAEPPNAIFSWQLDQNLWPPTTMPSAPLSMTSVEIARSCALRLVFERTSKGDRRYVRRTAFTGRIGTAIHRSIDRLAAAGYTDEHANAEAMPIIRQVWAEEIEAQRQQALACPRDARRPESETRIAGGPVGILSTLRLMPATHAPQPVAPAGSGSGGQRVYTPVPLVHGWDVVVEHHVMSADGLFAGIIDRAERLRVGVRIVDTKSTTRPEVPDRYRRQLQLYASMWNDSHPGRNMKVTEAVLSYPLLGTQHPVSIRDADVATTVGEARAAAARATQTTDDHASLSNPGPTCGVCCWRPWCQPFQTWIQADNNLVEAQKRSKFGWFGTVRTRTELALDLVLGVEWGRGNICRLIVPDGMLPHLRDVGPGTQLLVLDTPLIGQIKHARASVNGESEVFVLPVLAGSGAAP